MRSKRYLGKCSWLLAAILMLGFSPSLLHSQSQSVLDGTLSWTATDVGGLCDEFTYSNFSFQNATGTYNYSGGSVDISNAAGVKECPTVDSTASIVLPTSSGYPSNCTILFTGQGLENWEISTEGCGSGFQAFNPRSLLGDSLQLNNAHPTIPDSVSSSLPDSTAYSLPGSPVYFKTDDENNIYRRFSLVPVNHY